MNNARKLANLYHQYANLEEFRIKITSPAQEVKIECGSERITFISSDHVKELVCIIDVEKSKLRTQIDNLIKGTKL